MRKRSLKRKSKARRVWFCLFDLLNLFSIGYLTYTVVNEYENYWEFCPYPFQIFLVVQASLLVATFRIPWVECLSTMSTNVTFLLCFLVLMVTTTVGSVWFYNIKYGDKEYEFELTKGYELLTMVLLAVPTSLFCLLMAILIRLICLHDLRRATFSSGYGAQQDEVEDPQTEEIVNFYFNLMEKVVYETYDQETVQQTGK